MVRRIAVFVPCRCAARKKRLPRFFGTASLWLLLMFYCLFYASAVVAAGAGVSSAVRLRYITAEHDNAYTETAINAINIIMVPNVPGISPKILANIMNMIPMVTFIPNIIHLYPLVALLLRTNASPGATPLSTSI